MAEFSTTKQIMQMWVHLKISYKTWGSGGGYVAESCPTLAILWTVCNRQAPLSREFSRQEYWNGLPFPSPRDLPNPGIQPRSAYIAGRFFTNWAETGKWDAANSKVLKIAVLGLPWWLSGKESACQYRRCGFDPWSRKIPHVKEQLNPCATTVEPKLWIKRSHCNEKPERHN